MFEWISQRFAELPQDPMPLLTLIAVFTLISISTKLSKVIERLDAAASSNRYAQETAEKSHAEIENSVDKINSAIFTSLSDSN